MDSGSGRTEESFAIDYGSVPAFTDRLNAIADEVLFENPYNWTIYFNNDEHEIPFELTLRARRYSKTPIGKYFKPNHNDVWNFETKSEKLAARRFWIKERSELKLSKIVDRLKKMRSAGGIRFSSEIRPFTAVSYLRKHYVSKVDRKLRATVDTDIKYYYFGKSGLASGIGRPDYALIEIKNSKGSVNVAAAKSISDALVEFSVWEAPSKKDTSYYLLGKKIKAGEGWTTADKNTELEIKFSMAEKDQHIFHDLRNAVLNSEIDGLRLKYDYVIENNRLRRYAFKKGGEYLRYGSKDTFDTLTFKTEGKVVSDPFRIGYIMKRRKTTVPYGKEQILGFSPVLRRKRKYFIIEEERGGVLDYCVTIDKTVCRNKELFQLEIEAYVSSSDRERERIATRGLGLLSKEVISRYHLKPTKLTKFDWVKRSGLIKLPFGQ